MERSSGMERPISRQTRSKVAARISSLTTTAVGRSGKERRRVKVRCLFSVAVDDALVPPALWQQSFPRSNPLLEGYCAVKGQSDSLLLRSRRRSWKYHFQCSRSVCVPSGTDTPLLPEQPGDLSLSM